MKQTGEMEIKFSPKLTDKIKFDEIDLTTLEYEAEPGKMKPVIEIFVEPSFYQDEEDVKMSFEVLEFSQTKLLVKKFFENPLQISYDEVNSITVNFADPDFWVSPIGG